MTVSSRALGVLSDAPRAQRNQAEMVGTRLVFPDADSNRRGRGGPGDAVTLEVDPPVAVFNVDGEFLATDDSCTHEKYSPADGYIDGCQVECPLHWARFDLRTGAALTLPATRALATYPVRIENGTVLVDLTSRGTASG